ncbi:MAG: prepilin-type N-terminal cleavage/methylation domain-containing protein [Campylobacterota bacterium]
MNKAFSLIELIFAILIIGIISSFAIPKFVNSKDTAVATTIKRDIVTATSSVQSYVLTQGDITKLTDALNINSSNWKIEDLKATFEDSSSTCVKMEVVKSMGDITFEIDIDESNSGNICKKLQDDLGVEDNIYEIY